MKKNVIKAVLFSVSSLAALSAHAGDLPDNLRLIDELPIEQRVIAHDAVLNYLNQHPEAAANAKVIAVDGKGTVYALDENMVEGIRVGQPSCIGI